MPEWRASFHGCGTAIGPTTPDPRYKLSGPICRHYSRQACRSNHRGCRTDLSNSLSCDLADLYMYIYLVRRDNGDWIKFERDFIGRNSHIEVFIGRFFWKRSVTTKREREGTHFKLSQKRMEKDTEKRRRREGAFLPAASHLGKAKGWSFREVYTVFSLMLLLFCTLCHINPTPTLTDWTAGGQPKKMICYQEA